MNQFPSNQAMICMYVGMYVCMYVRMYYVLSMLRLHCTHLCHCYNVELCKSIITYLCVCTVYVCSHMSAYSMGIVHLLCICQYSYIASASSTTP